MRPPVGLVGTRVTVDSIRRAGRHPLHPLVPLLLLGAATLAGVGCREGEHPGAVSSSGGASPAGTGGLPGSGGTPVSGIAGATGVATVPGATCTNLGTFDIEAIAGGTLLNLSPTPAAVPPPAVSGGTLRVLRDDHTAVAADPDRDQVYIVDLDATTLTATVTLSPGDEPGRVIEDAAGYVHVALRRGGAVVTIDPATGTILGRRSVCAAPRGLVYQAATDMVHVACAGGELVSLPAAADGAIARTVRLDPDLRDIVVQGDHLWVSRFRAAEILDVDGKGALARRIGLGDFRSAEVRGGQLFTPSVAWRMTEMPGGGVAVAHQRGVTDEVEQSNSPGAYGGGGKGDTCNAIVHSALTMVAADGTTTSETALSGLPTPVDLAVSADALQIAVVSPANARSFSSRGSGPVMVGDTETVAHARRGHCHHNFGGACFAENFETSEGLARCNRQVPTSLLTPPPRASATAANAEITAVAIRGTGELVLQARQPAELQTLKGTIVLSSESRGDPGHELFHMNAGAGLACASCHAEGNDDGRVWNFTCSGARRTQSLHTGLRGTEPFHWNGDEKDFPQLVKDVFTVRMSGPLLEDQQPEMLLNWIDAQPRPPLSRPADTAAVARGRALFNDASRAGCATCHMGNRLTTAQTVDVGTGGKFQVPSLVGVGSHAPFMHNGCARTLRDRFNPACGGGDKHGVTSGLSAGEISDLTTFLETL